MKEIRKENGTYFSQLGNHEIKTFECSLFEAIMTDVIKPIQHLTDIEVDFSESMYNIAYLESAWHLLEQVHRSSKERLKEACRCLDKYLGEIRLIRACPGQIGIRDFEILDMKFIPTKIALDIISGEFTHAGPDDLVLGDGIEIKDGAFFASGDDIWIGNDDLDAMLGGAVIFGIDYILEIINPEETGDHPFFSLLETIHKENQSKIRFICELIEDKIGCIQITYSDRDQYEIREGQCLFICYYPADNVLNFIETAQTIPDKRPGKITVPSADRTMKMEKPHQKPSKRQDHFRSLLQ